MDAPTLSAVAADAIRAAVERVIPSDGRPGAREAGTAGYVLARAAAGDAALALYQAGAARLDALAVARGDGRPFASLSPADQDAILGDLDAAGSPFFRRLVVESMEGFYGDPRHGGNHGGLSWELLGFPGPTGGSGYAPPLGWYDDHGGNEG